jgi:hypothetical protein
MIGGQVPGLARGSLAALLGFPGDAEEIITSGAPYALLSQGKISPERFKNLATQDYSPGLPTAEEIARPLRKEGLLSKTPLEGELTETVGMFASPDMLPGAGFMGLGLLSKGVKKLALKKGIKLKAGEGISGKHIGGDLFDRVDSKFTNEGKVLLSKNTDPDEGPFRITYLDKNNEPYYHDDFPDLKSAEKELSKIGADFKKLSPRVVPPKNPLIVQHNIHPKAVERAERIGGIPSPSIAISKADDPLTTFGDISLLGPPEMAIPSGRNPVYRGDAYSSRMPQVVIQPDDKTRRIVRKIYGEATDQSNYDVAEIIGRYHIDGNTNRSKILEYNFLKSKGIKIKKPRKLDTKSPDNRIKNRENADIFEKEVREAFKKHTEETTGHPHNTNPQYLDWLGKQKNRIEKAGGRFDEKIFRGYTDLGNRRYAPATLENIMKEMKKGAGQESGFTGSMGAVRAQVAPKFKSLPEIKKSRDKIVSKDVFKEAKDKLSDELDSIRHDIYDVVDQHYSEKGWDRGFSSHSVIDSLVEDILVSTPRRSDYAEGLVDLIKPETIEKARVLRQKMRGMPTEYFEIKPRRGVDLSEFKGAIIPGHMDYSKNLKKILKKSGVKKILEYGSDEERKQLFKKFPELMFGLLPPVAVGGLLGSQGESNAQ